MATRRGRVVADSVGLVLQGSVIPPGTVQSFQGTIVPAGWLLCDGRAVSRSTYSALYEVLGVSNGSGDGVSTFNLPDLQGKFLRGKVQIDTVIGSGTASSNNATFTSHGIKRTGFKVQLNSGTLSGLTTSTDYFAIVIDDNTLAFATTLANAIAGTKIAISGANSAVIAQYEDPDASSRLAPTIGASSSTNLGSVQSDAFQNFTGSFSAYNRADSTATRLRWATGSGPFSLSGTTSNNTLVSGTVDPVSGSYSLNFNPANTARTSTETRPNNAYTNFIIKV